MSLWHLSWGMYCTTVWVRFRVVPGAVALSIPTTYDPLLASLIQEVPVPVPTSMVECAAARAM